MTGLCHLSLTQQADLPAVSSVSRHHCHWYNTHTTNSYYVIYSNKDNRSLSIRDVPDIRFHWPDILLFFSIRFWPKCWMRPDIATRYFPYLTNIDVGIFTYLLATKPCYLLQSATAIIQIKLLNLLVNYSWISNYTIHVPHHQIVVQWSNCHTIRFGADVKIYYSVHIPIVN